MELQQIIDRYAEALAHVDATTTVVGVNRRTKQTYQPGIQPMTESVVVPLLDDAWEHLRAGERHFRDTEVSSKRSRPWVRDSSRCTFGGRA